MKDKDYRWCLTGWIIGFATGILVVSLVSAVLGY